MRPIHSFLVVGLLALLGGVALFLVRSSSALVEVASAAPETPAPAGPGRSDDVELRAPSGDGASAAGSQRVVSSALPELAEEPIDLTAGAGSGLVVAGRVVAAEGRPIAGAEVFAASSAGLPLFTGFPLDARGAASTPWLRRVEAITDAEGRFELEGLKPGDLRLAVRAGGFAPHDADGLQVPAEERVDLGTFQLEPSVLVEGRVVDARGAGVAGAQIIRLSDPARVGSFGAFGSRAGPLVATSGPDGAFEIDQLASGPWALRFETVDHPDALSVGATTRPGERVAGLVVLLEDGDEIHGSVQGRPAGEELVVRALPRGGGEEEREDASQPGSRLRPEVRQAEVAADGSFRLRGLRVGGRYELTLTRALETEEFLGFGWSPGLAPRVRARAGERGVVISFQPEAALAFQVVDAVSGAPVEEYRVEAGIDWPMPQLDESGHQLTARPEGRARVGNLRPRTPSDKANLRIQSVGYRPYQADDLPLVSGQDTQLGVIALEPLPLLTVRVLDAQSGAPIEGANVTLSEVEPTRRRGGGAFSLEIEALAGDHADEELSFPGDSRQHARTDVDGLARVTIPIGSACRLAVRHAEHAPWRSDVFPAPTGAEEREVLLGRGGAVTVKLVDVAGEPVAGARVEHQAPGQDGGFVALAHGASRTVTNAAGEVEFAHLEPGTHRFRRARGAGGIWSAGGDVVALRVRGMGADDEGWAEAVVVEGGSSQLELVAPLELAVEGRVREAGEALAGARLQLSKPNREGPQVPGLAMLGGGGPRAESDGQGRYRIEGVEPGEYTLRVLHPSRAMPFELDVIVRDADLHQDIDLSLAIVEGRVTDAEGRPLEGVRVWPERARPEGGPTEVRIMAFASIDGGGTMISMDRGGFSEVKARTDADGRYQLRGVAPDVELQVRAEGKGVQPGRSQALRVAHDEVRRGVDLTLATAGQIEVQALNPDGSPARNVLVTARFEGPGAEDVSPRTEIVGEEGTTLIDGLAPGTWRLTARALGPQGEDPLPEQVVEVRAGESTRAQLYVP